MGEITKTNNYTGFFYKAFRNILLVSIPLTIISALILSLPHSSAYSSSTDSVALTLPSSCTISASVVTPHTITLVNGQKQDDIGNTKINAYCNDNNGYFIYAIGSSNDIAGNTDLISSVNSSYNIHTGIYPTTLTTSTPSSWAMKLSSNNGTYAPTIIDGYNNYSLIPETDTIVAYRASGTSIDINTDLTGSYFNTTYQIYANSAQPAGTYLGKVKYTMTHPYDANQLTTIEEAYDIAGKDKVTITDPTTGETIGNYYSMQDMSDRICNLTKAHNAPSEAQLVDIRDNKLYWVAKLDDGHCWMTQNLDFDVDTVKTYTHNDTDLGWDPNSFDANASWQPPSSLNPAASLVSIGGNSIKNWASDFYHPRQLDAGDLYFHEKNRFNSLQSCINAGYLESECKHFHVGNYYNWSAAVAENNTTGYSTDYHTVPNSICPAGWKLPKGLSKEDNTIFKSDFDNLLYQSGITLDSTTVANQAVEYSSNGYDLINDSPIYFVIAGDIDSSLQDLNNGFYWTNTSTTGGFAYLMKYNSSYAYPSYTDGRNRGMPIRCLAR